MSLNLSNPTNSFHIQLYRNTSRYIIACVHKPYLLLAGNLTWDNDTGIVNYTDTCTFLSCLNHSWWHNFTGDIYILRACKEIWLPVNLTRPWGASPLETYIWTSLQRTRHYNCLGDEPCHHRLHCGCSRARSTSKHTKC